MGQKHHVDISSRSCLEAGYIDMFGDNHENKEPLLLDDGTSVWFPAGWTDEDADKWRKAMNLKRPDGLVWSHHSEITALQYS